MPVLDMNRANMRDMALTMCGQSDNQSQYGTMVDTWLNEALLDIYGEFGIQDRWIGTMTPYPNPGARYVPMPPATIKCNLLIVYEGMAQGLNGLTLDYKESAQNLDFLSTGATLPEWYTYFGKPFLQVAIGPMPPDQAYPFEAWVERSPYEMVDDDQLPELPNRFRPALARFAAAQIILSDGLVHLTQKANMLMGMYGQARQQFQGFMTSNNGDTYDVPMSDLS